MNDIQIKGSEDYGKLCCFRDDEGNEEYGHLSLFMKANSNNPNERDMYFREEDGKAYRMAWKVDEEDVLSPDEEEIHYLSKTIERLQEQLNEANEVIKLYAKGTFFVKAREWNGKYYSTDPLYGSGLVDDFGKDYDAEVPCANDTEPAEKYLKKWGVK